LKTVPAAIKIALGPTAAASAKYPTLAGLGSATQRKNWDRIAPRKATTTMITNIDPSENDKRKGRLAGAGSLLEAFIWEAFILLLGDELIA